MICILKSNTLLLPDVFDKFRKLYLEIYALDTVPFITAPGLA